MKECKRYEMPVSNNEKIKRLKINIKCQQNLGSSGTFRLDTLVDFVKKYYKFHLKSGF